MGTVAKSIDETEIKLGIRGVSEGWSIKQGYPIQFKNYFKVCMEIYLN